ncbi:MAG TPA: glucose 1-dehydrogenase [Acidimicrobiales bacterium]|nr:glucose 1-dehydrogenase [Acidimicrobiales bacterium]
MGRVDGKVALVSGAARGMGAAHARLLVAEGASVVLGDVLDDEGATTAAGIGDRARYAHLDVRSIEDWRRAVATAVDAFGKLDVLVNNAGIIRVGSIEEQPVEDVTAVWDVNQLGVYLGMKAAIPAMRASGGGSIINISSTGGLRGSPFMAAYAASKWAVRGMTKVAALEVGHDGIRVNSVHPGFIDTDLTRAPEFAGVDKAAFTAALPVPRHGVPDDIARMVLFLASDDSAYCTGAEFVVDGGQTCGTVPPGRTEPTAR